MKEEKYMNNENNCNKYESFFIFRDEEAFNEHLEHCPDCKKEHEKYAKVSALLKEVAPVYLEKKKKEKKSVIKRLACCFVAFVGFASYAGYMAYDDYVFKTMEIEDSYVSTMGLPVDDYGFLEI